MITILQKNKYKRIVYSRPVLLILLVFIFFLGKAVLSVYEKARSTEENLSIAEVELDTLEDRGELLGEKLESLGTEKGIEAEIRDKFNVIKEGEKVIMIINPEVENDTESQKSNNSFWGIIKGLFRKD